MTRAASRTAGASPAGTFAAPTDKTTIPLADATVAAAGSSPSPSPRDHAHPRQIWAANDQGMFTWSLDLAHCTANSTPTNAGTINLVRVHLPVAASVTNVLMYATSGGSGLTSGQCFAGLWTAAGVKVGVSSDRAAAWAGNGLHTMALVGGPYACAAGDYYIGVWYNGTTSPAWARGTNLGTAFINVGLSAPNLRCATADTGLTTTAPTNLGAQTAFANYWWCALS